MTDKIKQSLEEAYHFATERKYEEALKLCNKIVDENPGRPDAVRTLVDIYTHMGDYDAASDNISKLVEQGSNEPSDYFTLGRAELFRRNYQNAVKTLTAAIDLGVEHKDHYYSKTCYFLRAEAFLHLHRYQEALADCSRLDDRQNHYFPGGLRTRAQIVSEAETGLARSKNRK